MPLSVKLSDSFIRYLICAFDNLPGQLDSTCPQSWLDPSCQGMFELRAASGEGVTASASAQAGFRPHTAQVLDPVRGQ